MYIIALLTIMIASLFHTSAEAAVPRSLGLPTVLKDEAGVRIPDGEHTIWLRIIDADRNVLYQEEQQVEVTSGVANLALGDGYDVGGDVAATTGGIPDSVFTGDGGPRYVQVEVDGYLPQTLAEVTSVAYALYSDTAEKVIDNGVTSAAIADGAVQEADLSQDLYQALFEAPIDPSRINGSLATTTYVDDKFGGKNVLSAAQIDAQEVHLNWTGGRTLKDLLIGLDQSLSDIKGVHLKNEANVRTQSDAVITTRVDNIETELDPTYLNSDGGDTFTGDYLQVGTLTVYPDGADPMIDPGIEVYGTLLGYGYRLDATEDDLAALGTSLGNLSFSDISGQITESQLPASAITYDEVNTYVTNISGNVIQSGTVDESRIDGDLVRRPELAAYLPKSGGTMAGNIDMASGTTVDGVDVSTLNGTVNGQTITLNDHENRIGELEGKAPITESDIPQAVRPFAYGVVDTFKSSTGIRGGFNLTLSSANTLRQAIIFSDTSASSENYIVTITPSAFGKPEGTVNADDSENGTQPCYPTIMNKTTSGFEVWWHMPNTSTLDSGSINCHMVNDVAYSVLVFSYQ